MSQAGDEFNNPEPAPQIPFQQDQPISEPARIGPGGRLIGTLLSPGETFQDINRKPTFLVPMIIGILSYTAFLTFVSVWVKPDWKEIVRVQATRTSERFGTPPPTDQDIQRGVAFTKYGSIGSGLIVIPIWYFLAAGVLALGMLLMQAKTTYKKILSVFGWVSC